MALESAIYQADPFSKDFRSLGGGGSWSYAAAYTGFEKDDADQDLNAIWNYCSPNSSLLLQSVNIHDPDTISSSAEYFTGAGNAPAEVAVASTATGRRKRRRTRIIKNKEEVENQRMTHIAVERNRRRQMNDYLSLLRSMMPPSYVSRVFFFLFQIHYFTYSFV